MPPSGLQRDPGTRLLSEAADLELIDETFFLSGHDAHWAPLVRRLQERRTKHCNTQGPYSPTGETEANR